MPSARIEHIGSTSVPGVWSKGDLDIFVGVPPREFKRAIVSLKRLGFVEKRGTLRNGRLWPFVAPGQPIEVGIQLVASGSEYEFFLRFRRLLSANPGVRSAYNALKRACVGLDETSYRRLKSSFVEAVLAADRSDRFEPGVAKRHLRFRG